MEAVDVDEDLPALELLPHEVVCVWCNVTYNRALPECPDTFMHRYRW